MPGVNYTLEHTKCIPVLHFFVYIFCISLHPVDKSATGGGGVGELSQEEFSDDVIQDMKEGDMLPNGHISSKGVLSLSFFSIYLSRPFYLSLSFSLLFLSFSFLSLSLLL